MSTVDQIKSKIDIVSLVSSYIKLEKAGANFKGRCPFHNEKTPSFFVSPDRGNYYCFGCHAKGDIFTFVEEFEGLDFLGALKVLADRAGVEIEQYKSEEKSKKERLFHILEQATLFYQKKLLEHIHSFNYVENRGINNESMKNFRIGFAPDSWRSLYEYLKERGVSEGEALSVGLIKQKDAGTTPSSFYDTFRNRIMFPISDSSGRVVGFSGRAMMPDEKNPKYLNTGDTELFNKSEILFGLDKAKKDIKLKDYSILVEGQMDLVLMHQAGITNSVASSGTALTENHLMKLKRLSERIIFCFDSDSAGFNAGDRSSKLALSLGMDLKLAELPKGKDPADLVKENPEVLKECLRNSKPIVDFYVDELLKRELSPKDLAIEIRKNVLPFIATMKDKIDQSQWIKSIMKKTFLNEEALWEDLKKVNIASGVYYPPPNESKTKGKDSVIERKIYGIILWLRERNKNRLEGVVDGEIIKIDVESRANEIWGDRIKEIEKEFEKDRDLLLFETESYYNNKNNIEQDIDELLISLEEEYLKKDLSLVMINLQKAEQRRESSEVLKYLEEFQRISQKINTIKTIKNAYELKTQ